MASPLRPARPRLRSDLEGGLLRTRAIFTGNSPGRFSPCQVQIRAERGAAATDPLGELSLVYRLFLRSWRGRRELRLGFACLAKCVPRQVKSVPPTTVSVGNFVLDLFWPSCVGCQVNASAGENVAPARLEPGGRSRDCGRPWEVSLEEGGDPDV